MPAIASVSSLDRTDVSSAADLLRLVSAGSCEPVDLLAVAVEANGQVAADPGLDEFLTLSGSQAAQALRHTGKAGQIAQLPVLAGSAALRVVLLGVGDRSAAALRRAGAELGRMLRPGESASASVVGGRSGEQARAFAEGVILGSYRFTQTAAVAREPVKNAEVRLIAADGSVATAAIIAQAVCLTRDLTNTPSVTKSPQWLAESAERVADAAGLSCRVWNEAELAGAGFGGICAVGSGSDRPPRLIELSYSPPGARRHVVLVGKGITFDSGGLSLKPNDGMKAMKTDMAGGAAVIAAMSALAALGITARVTGLVAAAENMPSGSAYRPGDVLTCYGGLTVEVLNTDAEGRLVLADAIAYAAASMEPDCIIDLATLTGAARIALGGSRGALYATSDDLAQGLLQAGEDSGDRLWRMPLVPEYRQVLDSPVADLANVSRENDGAGSVLAALFLQEFTGGRPWAHLDIAGAARSSGDDGELTPGATGFGTRVLLRWLQDG